MSAKWYPVMIDGDDETPIGPGDNTKTGAELRVINLEHELRLKGVTVKLETRQLTQDEVNEIRGIQYKEVEITVRVRVPALAEKVAINPDGCPVAYWPYSESWSEGKGKFEKFIVTDDYGTWCCYNGHNETCEIVNWMDTLTEVE